MVTSKGSQIPQPYGKKIFSTEWQRVFTQIKKNSPLLNFFDGDMDVVRHLLHISDTIQDDARFIVDELPTDFVKEKLNDSVYLVRGQYFEGGLHHRISFMAHIQSTVKFKEYPAHELKISSPLHSVSNIFIAYPTAEKPVYLEIPVEGAPPEIRVVEASISNMRAYTGKIGKIVPQTKYVQGMRVQFVDIGTGFVNGKLNQTAPDEIDIQLAPLSQDSEKLFQTFLEREFEDKFGAQSDVNQDKAQSQEAHPGKKRDRLKSRNLILIVSRPDLRNRMEEIIVGAAGMVKSIPTFELARDVLLIHSADGLILEYQQGEQHAVDFIQTLIRDGIIQPQKFAIIGPSLSVARRDDWSGLGDGILIREKFPDDWLLQKIANWLEEDAPQQDMSSDLHKPMVLCVDDDSEIRNAISSILSQNEFRVITACSGVEALNYTKSLSVNLILLDFDMPICSGLDVLRNLRSFDKTKNIPVIMLTGRSENEVIQQVIRYGISDYILKPFNEKNLLERTRKVILNQSGSKK